jgi:CheY-like chemotaxis protein
MNAVTGMSELILRENTTPRVREYAAGVKQAGLNLISIINDILDFSKIESGNLEIINANYDIASLLNDVINIIRMRVIEKPVLFITDVDSTLPSGLSGDIVRVRQILINVLNNAAKYTDTGFITFKVSQTVSALKTISLNIEISDSGRGIEPEYIDKIFGEFAQFDAKNNRGIEGSGLGLAITKQLCIAMGGDITVTSEYGVGSVFKVTLPQDVVDENRLAEVHNADEINVLVYEARKLYADSISRSLDNLGVKHTVVASFSRLTEALTGLDAYVTMEEGSDEYQFDTALIKEKFDFVFVSSFFYEATRSVIERRNIDTTIVVLSEAGTMVSNAVKIIPMPAYTLTIAHTLNNEDSVVVNPSEGESINFISPETNVLIVDDIGTNLMVSEGLMAPYKMQIEGATSGKEAIALVKEKKFDIIFMDHMMPEMDGVEAVAEIRKLDNGKDAVVIALTANAITGVEEMFKQNGFNDLLVKPIEIVKLNKILEKWIPKNKRKKYDIELSKAAQVVAQTAVLTGAADISLIDDGALEKVSQVAKEALKNIRSINMEDGITASGGDREFYIKVLNVYYGEGIKLKEKIINCLSDNNIKLYTTYIHGLKTSSANIGAIKLSELARKLEMASKENNMQYISENSDKFIDAFSAALNEIEMILIEDKELQESDGGAAAGTGAAVAEAAPSESPLEDNQLSNDSQLSLDSSLIEKLRVLKEAITALSIDVMDATINELSVAIKDESGKALIEQIQNDILAGDYKSAVIHTDDIIKNLKDDR